MVRSSTYCTFVQDEQDGNASPSAVVFCVADGVAPAKTVVWWASSSETSKEVLQNACRCQGVSGVEVIETGSSLRNLAAGSLVKGTCAACTESTVESPRAEQRTRRGTARVSMKLQRYYVERR